MQEKIEQIKELLKNKKISELSNIIKTYHPADIPLFFKDLSKEDTLVLFRVMPKELAADTFVNMDSDTQELLIKGFTDKELKAVVSELYVDDTVDIIEEMPANVVKRIIKNADKQTRKEINEILKYPDDCAGSIMTVEYTSLRPNMTVKEAFERIKKIGIDKETIYICYVTDVDRKILGVVSVRTLLLANEDLKIKDIMKTNIIYVHTLDDREEVARKFDKYDYMALPVVDTEERLVGIVTVDDAIDVLREENTEDFQLMAGIKPNEDSYFKTSVWKHARSRIFWLLFLMISATITGSIITRYEKAFEAIPLLVSFIPMLMDTGGNCGSQSSTMIIRGMAIDDIRLKDCFKALLKEISIGLIVGITLAIVNGIRIMIMYHDIKLAIVLGLTLISIAILAKAVGCLLPMLAKKCKLDPAIMAAPVLSTILDTCSVLIFFAIAMSIFKI